MIRRANSSIFQWLSVAATLSAVLLFIFELVAYSRARAQMPPGLEIASVPVGGLTREQALGQVLAVYSAPLELLYLDDLILLDPASVGFRPDSEAMLAAADQYRTEDPFWDGFWDFIWQRPGQLLSVPLRADYSEAQLRDYLADVAARYDQPSSPARPIAGSLEFNAGAPGRVLDVETSVDIVSALLQKPVSRHASLALAQGSPARPTFEALTELLKEYIANQGFQGLVDMAVIDLQTGMELRLVRMNGVDLPPDPDIAFAGMSVMKIPIVLDTFRKWQTAPSPETTRLITETIELSGNYSANLLLAELGGGSEKKGAESVTQTLRALGLTGTFLAGAYDQVEPPPLITTPANQREDLNTHPDIFMQTTPTDMAFLLESIYQCSRGGGALAVLFPGELTRDDCLLLLNYLSRNRIGVLIEAGVPEGTRVAHKQGWIGDTNSDAAIVFTPGGDYVLVVFLWQKDHLPWEASSPLIADLSRAVYNYFNPARAP